MSTLSVPFANRPSSGRNSLPHEQSFADEISCEGFFEELSRTYWLADWIDFGLRQQWRGAGVAALGLQKGMTVGDLMCGAGGNWQKIESRIGKGGKLYAVDFCSGMLARAPRSHVGGQGSRRIILQEDVLSCSIPDLSLDAAICTFGIKTLQPALQERFCRELHRMLKPGGRFTIVEMMLPEDSVPRWMVSSYISLATRVGSWVFPALRPHRQLLPCLTAFRGFQIEHALLSSRIIRLSGGCAQLITGTKRAVHELHASRTICSTSSKISEAEELAAAR